MMDHPVDHIDNAKASGLFLEGLPITVTERHVPGNCYVVSPVAMYGDYLMEETERVLSPAMAALANIPAKVIRLALVKADADRAVAINNHCVSTNLYPEGISDPVALTKDLATNYPGSAVIWKSVTPDLDKDLFETLVSMGCIPLPARQIWLLDQEMGGPRASLAAKSSKRDLRLLDDGKYSVVDVGEDRFDEASQLYDALYLEKYSRLNPWLGTDWLRHTTQSGQLELKGLENSNGQLVGSMGWFVENNVLTVPFLGYDTSLPCQDGLYRRLCVLGTLTAADRGLWQHKSAGAAEFKRSRGARPAIEYQLVFLDHLSTMQTTTWKWLAKTLAMVAVPVMRKLKL